jgi:hypothetical protein
MVIMNMLHIAINVQTLLFTVYVSYYNSDVLSLKTSVSGKLAFFLVPVSNLHWISQYPVSFTVVDFDGLCVVIKHNVYL